MRRLFADRDTRIYLAGQSLSLFGDSALWLAVAIYAKIITGSNSAAGLTFLAYICGALLAPISGVIADRVRRRKLLIVANLIGGAEVCALLAVSGRGQLWLIYLVMFGYGAIGSVITAAQTALLAVMLPEDLLGDANSLLQVAEVGLRVITPLVGAGLLALFGPRPVILLDAATFAGAGLAMTAIRLREPRPVPVPGRWHDEFTAGIRHVGRTEALRRMVIAGVGALLVFGFFQTVPFAVVSQGLHRPPTFFGVLDSLMGVGAVTGGIIAAPVMRRTGERTLLVAAALGCALGCTLLVSGWLPVVLLGMALVGVSIVWFNVAAFTLIQRSTPTELLGRVDAALSVALMIPQAASIALGAALIAVLDYRLLLLAMAVVFVLCAVELIGLTELIGWITRRPDAARAMGEPAPVTADRADAEQV